MLLKQKLAQCVYCALKVSPHCSNTQKWNTEVNAPVWCAKCQALSDTLPHCSWYRHTSMNYVFLSVVLYRRLRVTCDDMHLHYIEAHQFIDSPEWEANHDNSDDVFQVWNFLPNPLRAVPETRISLSHKNFLITDPHKAQHDLLFRLPQNSSTNFFYEYVHYI